MLGRPVGDKSVLAQVGYLPEHHRFPDYLTGAQVLDFAGAMAGTPRHERRARAGALLELVGMSAWANRRIKSYSKGMRQRVGIAQSLINDPDLVVLDEPTDGVDPVGRRDIRNILIQLRDRGHTVFLNSHLLSELELVCDRVAILVQGTVSSQGTIDELTTGRQAFEIELAAEEGSLAIDSVHAHFRAALPAAIANQPTPTEHVSNGMAKRVAWETQLATGERVEIDHQILRVCTADARAIQPIIDDLRSRGAVIRAVRPIRPSLEDLFMQAVTDPNTGLALAPGAAANGKERR
jgi:ABC-2 type transport system ATP-binding protein